MHAQCWCAPDEMGDRTMMTTTASTATVLSRPADADPNWREKIDEAKRAREAAEAARRDRPSSFYPVSGYSPR